MVLLSELDTSGADLARTARRAPLFLHRETYRRRRIMDAARLLPFFGTALLLLPMLWAETHRTSMGAVYVFVAWFGLILVAALMARRLSEPLRTQGALAGDNKDEGDAPPGKANDL
ncbi:MAG: DUF6611 family protein [Pseudomonadota bacterium]